MFLSCLFGEFPGVMALTSGFIADVTSGTKEKARIARMAFIDACAVFAGLPAGIIGGQLLKKYGFVSVFILSVCMNIVLLAYVIFILPDPKKNLTLATKKVTDKASEKAAEDTKAPEKEEIAEKTPSNNNATEGQSSKCSDSSDQAVPKINWDLFKPHLHIKCVFQIITAKERRRFILPPLFAFSLSIFGFVGELTTTALFLKGKPLHLGPDFVGYYYASQGLIRGISIILITQITYRCFPIKDINLILIGLLSQIFCFLSIGASSSTLAVFLSNVLGFGLNLALSLLRSYSTKQVPPEYFGTLLASFESLDALAFTLNIISLQIYNASLHTFPGTVFIFLASCCFLSFLTMIIYKYTVLRHQEKKETAETGQGTSNLS